MVYGRDMTYFQILNPHKLKEFRMINEEPLLRELIEEKERRRKRGRKRITKRRDGC